MPGLKSVFGSKSIFGSQSRSKFSLRSQDIRESNIRDAARLVVQLSNKRRIVNLGQGLPEFPADDILKQAAKAALDANFNQYSNTWGYIDLRQAVANKFRRYNNIVCDPETEITVTCGASEAIHAAMQAIVDPNDEVIIIEPFYENYLPDVLMAGAIPRYVRLQGPNFLLDEAELARAFNKRTRAILVNTPHNPTGRVFTQEELAHIARLCQKWNVVAIADEIYEYMIYGNHKHISLATLPGMKERTITISGLSKTFSVTGWRLGYMAAPADYTRQIRKLHDYITLAAPSPLQMAGITALNLPDDFYRQMSAKYQTARDQLMEAVGKAGFKFSIPEGTYYLFTDASHLGFEDDRAAWEYLLKEHGIATVAGYCFFRPEVKTNYLRFCYAKYPSTIEEGAKRLLQLVAANCEQEK
jgi:aminotransferase